MDEKELARLAHEIEEIKRAVRRNTPAIHDMFGIKGWDIFSLAAGSLVSAFGLGSHVLTAAYGGFERIPAGWQALLYSLLALIVVGSSVAKFVMVARHTVAGGPWRVYASFLGGGGKHIFASFTATIAVALVAAFWIGQPWVALPVSGILLGLMSIALAGLFGQPSFYPLGWWAVVSGAAGLWFYAAAPFLWVFIIYGGMFFVFAGAVHLQPRRPAAEPDSGGQAGEKGPA
jgi:hypothetical protein